MSIFETSYRLKDLIQGGKIKEAIQMVGRVTDHRECEQCVFVVLEHEKSTSELVKVVLEAFLNTKPDYARDPTYGGGHGGWVHSLSHFTDILWKRRMDGWIKKFNEVSFNGANELHDSNCSERLVEDFGKYAKYNDDPADFALTPENLRWMDKDDFPYANSCAYAKSRIEEGKFESEGAFLRWKLHRPETHTAFDYDAQTDLVNLDGIRSLVQKLQELGADTSEFNGLERDLLTKRLNELDGELLMATEGWKRERLEKGIQKTRAALA